MDYFIDECGHTGDLAKSNATNGFGGQPIFALAAIGVADHSSLQSEIDRLKAKHGMRLNELKSSARRDRPEFALDVVRLLCCERYPLFLEAMDKKYFLATHITSCQLLPPIRGFSEDVRTHFVRSVIADYIFEHAPDDVFATLIEACKSPSDVTLRTQLEALVTFSRSAPRGDEPHLRFLS